MEFATSVVDLEAPKLEVAQLRQAPVPDRKTKLMETPKARVTFVMRVMPEFYVIVANRQPLCAGLHAC